MGVGDYMQGLEIQKSSDLRPDVDSFQRKEGHIALAHNSQTLSHTKDPRFFYEPLFYHQSTIDHSRNILGKKVSYPLWISSMTGGTEKAKLFNQNLAQVARQYKLGMGLGSIRPLLYSHERFSDFDLRNTLGPDLPLVGNIGIAQVEELISLSKLHLLDELCQKLELNGLFIHLNLLQEWFQPNGDVVKGNPLEILKVACDQLKTPILIKEVGHGFGPKSLEVLLDLPIAGIEFGAYGGTNFSLIEEKRKKEQSLEHPLIFVGHTTDEMMDFLMGLSVKSESLQKKLKDSVIIVSGGMHGFLDGHYALEKMKMITPALYAHAKEFIVRAHSPEALFSFVENELKGLDMASRVLTYNPHWKK